MPLTGGLGRAASLTHASGQGNGEDGGEAALASRAAGLLLLPLVAMQFTDDVVWDAFDFVFMGTLPGGVGLGRRPLAPRGGAVPDGGARSSPVLAQ